VAQCNGYALLKLEALCAALVHYWTQMTQKSQSTQITQETQNSQSTQDIHDTQAILGIKRETGLARFIASPLARADRQANL